jgi:nitrate reductase gamma subunit
MALHALTALVAVILCTILAFLGGQVDGLRMLFGVVVPYAALLTCLAGLISQVLAWSRVPVPFRIPVTCGQQKSLPWIKAGWLESPSTGPGVIARMALEIGLFRSLFRNMRVQLREGPRLIYGEEKVLWLAALVFHWSFLVIVLRHLRFFLEPVPGLVTALSAVDGFFQVGTPGLYATDVLLMGALSYLVFRRLWNRQVRYISLFADYFVLFLLLGLAVTGILMRYVSRIDTVAVKQLALGLATFSPVIPREVGPLFFSHLFLLSLLVAWLPFSKLTHMAGIFLSPTRNLANTNRMTRHVNPWNAPVAVHTYEEWEEEFREKIAAAGLPLERK